MCLRTMVILGIGLLGWLGCGAPPERALQFDYSVVGPEGAGRVAIGDIDNDGDQDIVTSRSWEDPPLMLWRNLVR